MSLYFNGKKITSVTRTKVIPKEIEGIRENNGNVSITKDFEDIEVYGNQKLTFYGLEGETKEIYNSQGDLLASVENDELVGGGTDTSDATATADDILQGKTAYIGAGKVEGTIPTYNGENEGGEMPSDLIEQLCNDTLTSYSNSNITDIISYLFYGYESLKSASFSNATSVGNSSFRNCKGLVNIYIPKVTSLGAYAFHTCSLVNVDISSVTNLSMQCFVNNTKLPSISLPKVKTIQTEVFRGCSELTNMYLGYEGLVSLSNTNAFSGVTAGLKVHVRSQYADQYATATNWTSLIENGTIVIVGDYSD